MTEIIRANREELPQILEIYAYAREYMRNTGNPNQWRGDTTRESVLLDDIEKGNLYVLKSEGAICAVFACIVGEDPTYTRIDGGRWLSDGEYATLHRVAGNGSVRGVFHKMIEYCTGIQPHLRIVTHEDNKIMQHLIEKNGFTKCGIIYISDGSPRIAYERI